MKTTRLNASRLRQRVARHMAKSHAEIPAAGDALEIKVSCLVEFREKFNNMWGQLTGASLRYDYILAYIAMKFLMNKRFRVINGYWDKNLCEGFIFNDINLGISVNAPPTEKDPYGVLIIPVIDAANKMSFEEFSGRAEDKILRAKQGKLKLSETRGLTFTINNTGVLGGIAPDSIVPYTNEGNGRERPTGMIIMIGALEYRDGNKYLKLGFRFDHRLLDGGVAAGFVMAIKGYIESKIKMQEFEEIFNPGFLKN